MDKSEKKIKFDGTFYTLNSENQSLAVWMLNVLKKLQEERKNLPHQPQPQQTA